QDMKLSHGPTVKPRLDKEICKNVAASNLNVTGAYAQSTDAQALGQRSVISVVEQPANRVDATLHARNFDEGDVRERVPTFRRHLKARLMRSFDPVSAVHNNIDGCAHLMTTQEILNSPGSGHFLLKWNGRNLCE